MSKRYFPGFKIIFDEVVNGRGFWASAPNALQTVDKIIRTKPNLLTGNFVH